jgi:hypothetical protein
MATAFLPQLMKRLINICLFLTFLLGYLEWGKSHTLFIFQAEFEIFLKGKHDFKSILHPFILIPFFGQAIILYCIFQKNAGRVLNLAGLACLSMFMLLLFTIGLLTLNIKIIISTVPFIIAGILLIKFSKSANTMKNH